MNIFVAGGAGFIGSNFVRYMVKKYPNMHFLNFDKLTYAGNLDNLKEIENHSNYSFVKGDLADQTAVSDALRKFKADVVINFAAESHVDRSITNPTIFAETNVLGTQILLEESRLLGVEKYVQVSTDEVYGSLGETGFFTEETPLAPNSPYSASKASADLFVRAYHETYGMNVNITRCSNNYGPYHYPEKLIPLMITNAMDDMKLPIYGDGLNIRDWLHVQDHCEAIEIVLQKGKPGEVYNIGGNNERTNREIVHSILSNMGKSEELIEFVEDRKGHDRRYAIDHQKITEELGWQPKYTFEEGLKETIAWYHENEEWWRKLKNMQLN